MSTSMKTIIVAVSALILIFTGWFFLLYRPKVSDLHSLKEDTQNLVLKLQSFRVSDQQILILEKEAENLGKEIEGKRAKILPKDQLPLVIQQFRSKGTKFGLKFEQMIPDYETLIKVEDEKVSEVLKLTVHMKLQGHYKNLGQFIDSIDQLPFLVSFGDIRISYEASIFPELVILMDAILYLLDESEAKA